jgi:hypothetical protein
MNAIGGRSAASGFCPVGSRAPLVPHHTPLFFSTDHECLTQGIIQLFFRENGDIDAMIESKLIKTLNKQTEVPFSSTRTDGLFNLQTG